MFCFNGGSAHASGATYGLDDMLDRTVGTLPFIFKSRLGIPPSFRHF